MENKRRNKMKDSEKGFTGKWEENPRIEARSNRRERGREGEKKGHTESSKLGKEVKRGKVPREKWKIFDGREEEGS